MPDTSNQQTESIREGTKEVIALFREEKQRLFCHPKGGLSVLLDYPPHDKVLDEGFVEKFIERICESYEIKLSQAYQSGRDSMKEEVKEVVQGMRKEKDGKAEMTYSDGRKIDLKLHSDMAVGFNQALYDLLSKLKEL